MDKRPFFAELKRRNVLRAAALCSAGAWLLVQVFPFFHIAEWVVRVIVLASVIGFPFAMLFSWFYEWTPKGLLFESEIPPNESHSRETRRKLDRWIIAVSVCSLSGLMSYEGHVHRPTPSSSSFTAAKACGAMRAQPRTPPGRDLR